LNQTPGKSKTAVNPSSGPWTPPPATWMAAPNGAMTQCSGHCPKS